MFEISNVKTVGFYVSSIFRLLGEWQNRGFPRPWAQETQPDVMFKDLIW